LDGRSARKTAACAAAATLAALAGSGCFTYSSYQSARIVERGERQATLAVSRSSVAGREDAGASWVAIEGGGRFGIVKRVDGAFMLSVFRGVPKNWGAGVLTLDVRGGIIKDHLACALPVSVTLGDFYLASLRMQPGLIATIPLGTRLEITGAVRAHVFVRFPELFAWGYNLGLGIRCTSGGWMLRPELGWMQFTGKTSGPGYMQYGVGLELNHRKPEATKERGL